MITLGLSSHRIEFLDFMRAEMERHDLILLEEPPHPRFDRMLRSELTIEEYIEDLETAFPQYSKMMCIVLRELYKKGRVIQQVEPYLKILEKIHEMLVRGVSPDEILKIPIKREVYLSESKATKTLLNYYSKTLLGTFEQVIEGVKEFAKADAHRGRLRERMRARAIANQAKDTKGDIYVEVGYLHFPMFINLKRELGDDVKVKPVFLQSHLIEKLTGKSIRQILSPGDILTLRYRFGKKGNKALEDLLAARSLIFIKLLTQDEIPLDSSEFPHTEEEIKLSNLVERLTYEDCERLFKKIRFLKKERASEVVTSYVETLPSPS